MLLKSYLQQLSENKNNVFEVGTEVKVSGEETTGIVSKIFENKVILDVDNGGFAQYNLSQLELIEETEMNEQAAQQKPIDLAALFQKHNNDWNEVWQDIVYDHELLAKDVYPMIKKFIEDNNIPVGQDWQKEVKGQQWFDENEQLFNELVDQFSYWDMHKVQNPSMVRDIRTLIRDLEEYFEFRLVDDIPRVEKLLNELDMYITPSDD